MRVAAIVLGVFLVLLQYRLWVSPEGARAVWQLRSAVAGQQQENGGLAERNAQLKAEVKDLKEGLVALEERARHELGMVVSRETFDKWRTVPNTVVYDAVNEGKVYGQVA